MPAFLRDHLKTILRSHLVFSLLLLLGACSRPWPEDVARAYEQLPERIDFNFHVRPILSDRCFSCHGPDDEARKADLRLDLEASAFAALASGRGHALVPGRPERSRLVERILSTDVEQMMPPPDANLTLSEKDKATLLKWVEQGAEWKEHWAFIPPKRPAPPVVRASWPAANAVDSFIYRKLEQAGMQPSPPADRERLLRRLYLDLTGLPPTIEDMDAFLADERPGAYERVVDRLLASQANAEHLALDWMDLSRYADSHGMHADGYRMMWPWRDWVIQAFLRNIPYDQFVTWQLAGDLLPAATREQRLATAFNRNHPMTAEGGVIDEEFRLQYVFDRAETVATAFLGLTLNCARCHDHKFDPISQEEYYRFTAFFNNVKELGMTGDDGNYGPMLLLPDPETEVRLQLLQASISAQEATLEHQRAGLARVNDFIQKLPNHYRPPGQVAYLPLDRLQSKGEQTVVDGNPKATSAGQPALAEGKVGKALQLAGNYDEVHLGGIGLFDVYEAFSAGLWINTIKKEKYKTQVLLGTAGNKNNFWRGWDFFLDDHNRLNARLIHSLPHNYLHVQTLDSVSLNTWTHVAFTYDGSGTAAGLRLYLDGQTAKTIAPYDRLYKSIYPITGGAHLPDPARALRVGRSYRAFTGENGIFKGRMDEIRCFNQALSALDVALIAGKYTVDQLRDQLPGSLWRQHTLNNDPTLNRSVAELRRLQRQELALVSTIPEVMVMEEMPRPRPTFIYHRGAYDAPTRQVSAATPEKLMPFPADLPRDRLGLARWLFHPGHPLTARVTVNRYWQLIFGRGLVETPHDFGVQGSLPTHPELLDWLACYFRKSNWDVKALLKLLVLSNTYRQSSAATPEQLREDPYNLLLGRGASYRLAAEQIRDNALAASGLLVKQVGGESVKPYQPADLWIEKGNFSHVLLHYKATRGDSLYRRSLYTFVRRTSPHPYMTTFDAPTRDVCTVRRENTNTPLQALILMNDTQFVEAARALAEGMQKQGGHQIRQQLVFAFRRVTGRHPKDRELELLEELYNKQLGRFRHQPDDARELLSVGDFPADPALDPVNTAALTMVANTLFNHDEAYTKR